MRTNPDVGNKLFVRGTTPEGKEYILTGGVFWQVEEVNSEIMLLRSLKDPEVKFWCNRYKDTHVLTHILHK